MKIRYRPMAPFDPQSTGRIREEQHGLHPDDVYLSPAAFPTSGARAAAWGWS